MLDTVIFWCVVCLGVPPTVTHCLIFSSGCLSEERLLSSCPTRNQGHISTLTEETY